MSRNMALLLLLFVVAVSLTDGGIPPSGDLFFEFTGGEATLPFSCLDCWITVDLDDTYYYFGKPYNRVFVNSNGYITFDYGVYWYNSWPTSGFWGPPMIAPHWQDSDLGLGVTTASLKWEETTSNNRLQRAKGIAKKKFNNCPTKFVPTSVFIVTWEDVPSYCEWGPDDRKRDVSDIKENEDREKRSVATNVTTEEHHFGVSIGHVPRPSVQQARDHMNEMLADEPDVARRTADDALGNTYYVNSFQVVLATDGFNTFAIMHYLNPLEWIYCSDWNKLLFNAGDCCGFYMEPRDNGYDEGSNVNRKARFAYRIDGHNNGGIVGPFCQEIGTPADDDCEVDYYDDYYDHLYYYYYYYHDSCSYYHNWYYWWWY